VLLRWALIGLGVLIVGVAAALSFTVLDDGDETSSSGDESVAAVGEPIALHDVSYTVTGVRTARRLFEVESPTQFDEPRQTSGVFVAVGVSLRNDGDELASASFHGSSLVGGNGETYVLDALSLGTYYDLEPDLVERGRLVFDVPPAATPGAVLVIADCPVNEAFEPDDCASARVDLELR
jgi:hypothetical protein